MLCHRRKSTTHQPRLCRLLLPKVGSLVMSYCILNFMASLSTGDCGGLNCENLNHATTSSPTQQGRHRGEALPSRGPAATTPELPRQARVGRKKVAGAGKVYHDTNPSDVWLKMQGQKANLPDLHAWRHRFRVMEHVLQELHPDRDHIRRVIASEEIKAREDAAALMRSQVIILLLMAILVHAKMVKMSGVDGSRICAEHQLAAGKLHLHQGGPTWEILPRDGAGDFRVLRHHH